MSLTNSDHGSAFDVQHAREPADQDGKKCYIDSCPTLKGLCERFEFDFVQVTE